MNNVITQQQKCPLMPRSRIHRRIALIGIVALLLVLAGCSATPSSGLSDADEIGENVQDRYDKIEKYSATVERTIITPDGEVTRTVDIHVKTGEEMVVQYRNGPMAGTIETVDLAGTSAPQTVVSNNHGISESDQSPLETMTRSLLETHNVSVERSTMYESRPTVVLSIQTQNANNSSENNQYLWVDTERQVPLKYKSTWQTTHGETVTEIIRLSNVSINEQPSENDG